MRTSEVLFLLGVVIVIAAVFALIPTAARNVAPAAEPVAWD